MGPSTPSRGRSIRPTGRQWYLDSEDQVTGDGTQGGEVMHAQRWQREAPEPSGGRGAAEARLSSERPQLGEGRRGGSGPGAEGDPLHSHPPGEPGALHRQVGSRVR